MNVIHVNEPISSFQAERTNGWTRTIQIGNPGETRIKKRVLSFPSRQVNVSPKKAEKKFDSSETEIPGLKNIMDKEKGLVYNFFWAFLVISSTCICFYQIYDRCRYFIEKPTVFETHVRANSTVKFPALTICSYQTPEKFHRFRVNYAAKYNLSSECGVNYLDYMKETGADIETAWGIKSVDPKRLYEMYANQHNDDIQLQKIRFAANMAVCIKYVFPRMLRYSSERTIFFIQLPYLPELHCDNQGLGMLFHTDEVINTFHSYTATFALTKRFTIAYLTIKKFKHLNTPKRPCVTEKENWDCILNCAADKYRDNVTCRMPYMRTLTTIPLCSSYEEAKVQQDILSKGKYLDNFDPTDCKCARACEETVIRVRLLTFDKETNETTLQIKFEDNVFEEIIEVRAYSLISLLCDIGGNLGLYLGLCLLTMIQILEEVLRATKEKMFEKNKETLQKI